MFAKLNKNYEIIQNSCDITTNGICYKIDCFDNYIFMYSIKNKNKVINYLKVDYLGNFLIKNITDDIKINNKIYMSSTNLINHNDLYFRYEYFNINKLRNLIEEHFNLSELSVFDSLPTNLSKTIFGNYCLLYINGGIVINNYFSINTSFYKIVSNADLILTRNGNYLNIAFIACKKKMPVYSSTN